MIMGAEFKLKTAGGSADSPREFRAETIKLVIGLGNPGAAYARTYHNAGRLVARAFAGIPESKFHARENFLSHRTPARTFVIPQTFMNESGRGAAAARRAFRAKPQACLVIHDDADLPLGAFRLQYGRGSAGHHGVESVIRAFGTKEFWRLRIGIRPPQMEREKVDAPCLPAGRFVLRPMTRAAETAIRSAAEEFQQRYLNTSKN
ncbi:MAG: aminoacyl-tRNA hydrolase [Candidatus Brennerbacteria bacterium]|nr:aminoacyl-tRNA hydrolase [Candidatus Brennerbacteria bacterium]